MLVRVAGGLDVVPDEDDVALLPLLPGHRPLVAERLLLGHNLTPQQNTTPQKQTTSMTSGTVNGTVDVFLLGYNLHNNTHHQHNNTTTQQQKRRETKKKQSKIHKGKLLPTSTLQGRSCKNPTNTIGQTVERKQTIDQGYGTVRYGAVRCGTVQYGTVRYGTVRYGTVRYGTVR